MKIKKDGNVCLDEKDTRVGNFVFTEEEEHVKAQDIGRMFVVRLSKRLPIGIWLSNIIGMASDGLVTLKTWVATIWTVLSVAPDNDYIRDLMNAAEACLNRHKDWYGIKDDATEEDDAKAVEEMKEMSEFEDDVKKALEKEKEDGGKEE
jgi:hypothetical protein